MSLDTIDLVLELESRFDVKLSDEQCGKVRTVGDVARLVQAERQRPRSKMSLAVSPIMEERQLVEIVREIVAKHVHLPIETVQSNSRFLEDLGV